VRGGFEDQAAGLRRLLSKAPPQVVAVLACGTGALRWTAGQVMTRAQAGRQVLLFDEAEACGNLGDVMGVSPRFDLGQVVEGEVPLEQAQVQAAPGCTLHSAARLARRLAGADRIYAARFRETCRRLQNGSDLWVIHARPDESMSLSPFALAAQRLVVAVDGSPRSVTEAYALIKRLEGGPWAQLDLALGGCRRPNEGEALLDNLMQVAQRQTVLALRRIYGLEASAAAAAVSAGGGERFLDRVLGLAQRATRAPLALGT